MFKKIPNAATFASLALAVLLTTVVVSAPQASAESDMFTLSVYHGINGRSLGLDKGLPVDIYVNTMPGAGDAFVEDVTFKTRLEGVELPAGEYAFYVTLADTTTTIMSFGPADIPAGADVFVHAKLGANKTPELKVRVK